MRLGGLLVGMLLLGACATAGSGDDDGAPPDADPGAIDAMPDPPDAGTGPQVRTLTQSNSPMINGSPYTLNCNEFDPPPPATPVTATAENRFFRVFDLNALGIHTVFTVTKVDFAIEDAQADAGSLTVKVKLHTLSAAPSGNSFPLANLTQIYTQDVSITTPQTGVSKQVTLTTPAPVPGDARLVVEVFAPDLTPLGDGNSFFLGSNGVGETGPTWVAATACGINDPTRMSTLASPDPQVDWVMDVQGTLP